jgi:hypothetical protein
MSWTAFLAPIIAIGIFVLPILLLRRKAYPRAQYSRKQDSFVTSDRTLPRVIQNSSIAYAIRMATFGPFFAWGAAGDFRPAIVVAVAFALGVLLVYALRRHLLDFLGRALASDASITVNDFVARLCGNDPRVRRLAACLTVFALAGFILCELIGVANVMKPMLSGDSTVTYVWIVGLLVLTAAMTMLAGQSGVMHSAQLQLGILLFGLFTSTVFLIYLQISTLRAMPPRGTFAIAAIFVLCAVLLIYRRNRYIDSTSLRGSDADPNEREPSRFRRLRRFQKVLNTVISVVAVLVIVVAGMELYSLGLPTIASDGAAALRTASRVPAWGFAALVLLPLAYPIVDIVNWQRLAAFEKDRDWSYFGPGQWPAALKEFFVTYAVESPLVWLFLCMFGAIATLSLAPDGSDAVQAFVSQLVSDQNFVAEWTLSLLLVAVLAIALSTTTAALSASLAAVRYDLMPMPDAASAEARASHEATAERRIVMIGAALCVVIAAAFFVADAVFAVSFTSSTFLALIFAFGSAQLALAPLVIGPLLGSALLGSGGPKPFCPGWALAVLATGAAAGIGAAIVYLATGQEAWLWTAVPACLGSGAALFALGRLVGR